MPMSTSFRNRLFPQLPQIIQDFGGTPFHIYDEQGIVETCNHLKLYMKTSGFQQFFAVKALPDPAILRIIHEQGFGFDCSSIVEMVLATEAGATPDQIMFTSNDTTREEFQFALNLGCIINLDDIKMLDKPIIREQMPELICFRINPGAKQTGNSIIGNPLDAKYGIMWDEIIPAYRRAQELGATRFGIHMMVMSNDRDHNHAIVNVDILLEAAAILKKELGIEAEFINIGGGIGTPYHPEEEEFNLAAFGFEVTSRVQHFRNEMGFEPRVYTELGRYITGPHGCYATRAINRKDIYGQVYVGVEAAMTALMRPAIYGVYHHITVVDKDGRLCEGDEELVHIVGPICENCDRLTQQDKPRLLPKIHWNEDGGDLIIVHNTGAHAIAMAFNYNGRPRPQALLLRKDGSIVRTRKAETIKELLAMTQGL